MARSSCRGATRDKSEGNNTSPVDDIFLGAGIIKLSLMSEISWDFPVGRVKDFFGGIPDAVGNSAS
jgi:hypothetical protein